MNSFVPQVKEVKTNMRTAWKQRNYFDYVLSAGPAVPPAASSANFTFLTHFSLLLGYTSLLLELSQNI